MLSPLLTSLSVQVSLPLSQQRAFLDSLSIPLTSRYTHLLFFCPPDSCPLPPACLSQDEKRSVRESAERKNRRVNRGERSRAFYTRYKYLQKCGWNTWNTHEEKERVANIAAVRFLHSCTCNSHVPYTHLQKQ